MKNVYMGNNKKFGICYGIQYKRYGNFYFIYLTAYDIRNPGRTFESKIPLDDISIGEAIMLYYIFSAKNL